MAVIELEESRIDAPERGSKGVEVAEVSWGEGKVFGDVADGWELRRRGFG